MSGTPGPWKLSLPDDTSVLGADGSVVAEATGNYCINSERMEANARLIAAAPELLEACKQALRRTSMSDGLREEIEAAIAKAEGRA